MDYLIRNKVIHWIFHILGKVALWKTKKTKGNYELAKNYSPAVFFLSNQIVA